MDRRSFGAAFATGATNLDLMRLGGALLVLASHAWILTGDAPGEPFAPLLGRYTDGGGLAVGMFFVVSGFLIARSASVHPLGVYARARFLRIYPAFAVAVVLQTLLVGLVATRLPATAYLRDGATWTALIRGLVVSPALGLPGVFETNPVPGAVNGSLWTVRIEVLCYVLAGLVPLWARLGLGRLARGWMLLPLVAGFVALAGAQGGDARVVAILDCAVHFAMGAALWCYRDQVPRRGWLAALGVLVLVAGAGRAPAPYVWHLVFPYLVLWAGLGPPVAAGLLRRLGDVSYGTYLYAFPIEQGLVAYGGAGLGPWRLIALAAPLALGCGALSRALVERPALRARRPG